MISETVQEVKASLGHGSQRSCSSEEKTALLHDTVDNLGLRRRSRIEGNEVLSDADLLSLPKSLRGIDDIICAQLELRNNNRRDYAFLRPTTTTMTTPREHEEAPDAKEEEAVVVDQQAPCRVCKQRCDGDLDAIYRCRDCGHGVCNGCSHLLVTGDDDHQYRCMDGCGKDY